VFQIWVKRDTPRDIEEKVQPIGFTYVKATEEFHMAFRRVGVNAGTSYLQGEGPFSAQSHYFIAFDEKYLVKIHDIKTAINTHVFPSNTVGPRSLSKGEANQVINAILSLI
jgi:hypothetical protein